MGVTQVNGWTEFTASQSSVDPSGWTTRRIYVSSSTGNDGTAIVGDITKPYASLNVAVAQMTQGKPDWLLLKRGDTWTGDVAGVVSGSDLFGNNGNIGNFFTGFSSTEPAVIGCYDPAFTGTSPLYAGLVNPVGSSLARPLLNMRNSDVTGINSSNYHAIDSANGLDYFAVVGIEFYAFESDPANGSYVNTFMCSFIGHIVGTALTVDSVAAGALAIGQGIVAPTGSGITPGTVITGGSGTSWTVNNSQSFASAELITGSWGQVGSVSSVKNLNWGLVEDCRTLFCGGDVFSTISVGGILSIRRNVRTDGYQTSLTIQDQTSVLLEENFLDHNGWQPNGYRNTFSHNVYGHQPGWNTTNQIWNYLGNISTRGSDVGLRSRTGGNMVNNYVAQCGQGFDFGGACTPATVNSIANNVVQQCVLISPSFPAGWGIQSGTDSSGNNRPCTISGNIVVHAFDATAYNTGFAGIDCGGGSKLNTVSSNIVGDWGNDATVLLKDVTGNNTFIAGGGIGTTAADLVAYAAANGLNWPSPNRTAATYDADVLSGPGTFADFVAQVKAQSKQTWNVNLTAAALNNYIRAGFGIGATSGQGSRPFFLTRL